MKFIRVIVMRTFIITCLLCVSFSISASPANDEDLRAQSSELFHQIWSPYCKGVSLLECPSSQAQTLRDELRLRLKNGESSTALLQDMYQRFGKDTMMMEPPSDSRGSIAYWLPWLSIFLAAIGVILFWRYRRQRISAAVKNLPPPSLLKTNSNLDLQISKDLSDRFNS